METININPVEKITFVDDYNFKIVSSYDAYRWGVYNYFSNNFFEEIDKQIYFLSNNADLNDIFYKDDHNILIFNLDSIRTTTNVSMDVQTIYFDISSNYNDFSLKDFFKGKLLHPVIIIEKDKFKNENNIMVVVKVEDLEVTRRKKLEKIIKK